MSGWNYRKPEPSNIRGLCCHCNKNPQKKKAGKDKYQTLCSSCDKKKYQSKDAKENLLKYKRNTWINYSYKRVKTNVCCMCGFTSEYSCQLDVDHIDGDHSNNDLSNLQTLCANCHRLKTFLNNEGMYR